MIVHCAACDAMSFYKNENKLTKNQCGYKLLAWVAQYCSIEEKAVKALLDIKNLNPAINLNGIINPSGDEECEDDYDSDADKTVLMHAAYHGNLVMVRALLGARVDVDVYNQYGKTALMYAARKHHMEVMKLLLAVQEGIACSSSGYGTALMASVGGRYGDIVQEDALTKASVELLIDSKADVNIKSLVNRTVLMGAVGNNNSAVVTLLLDRKADLYIVNDYGYTALAIAAMNGNIQTARIIIEACGKQLIEPYYASIPVQLKDCNVDQERENVGEQIVSVSIERILPREIMELIFGWLDAPAIAAMRCVNSHCHVYAQDEFQKIKQRQLRSNLTTLTRYIESAQAKIPVRKKASGIIELLEGELEKIENLIF